MASASSLGYVQRQPDKTLLYQTIQEHMATFFAQCESFERSLPLFIKEEFEAFLRCGMLAHGFVRVYCRCLRVPSLPVSDANDCVDFIQTRLFDSA